jgi:putative sigma-54 modulation protein
MEISITGRNIDLTPALKKYVIKKLDRIEKFYSRIDKCDVILEEEKIRRIAEVVVYLRRTRIVAKESSTDMYASIDNASDIVKKQLRRLRGKVFSKRRKAVLARFMGRGE